MKKPTQSESRRKVRLIAKTIWRDKAGKITERGALRAVTATTPQGVVWDVSSDDFKIITP